MAGEGRWQHIARAWVRSAFTELLVCVLLLLDISLAIYEATRSSPEFADGMPLISAGPQEGGTACSVNQIDALSGVILLFYTFEATVRIFAFRWAIVDGSRRMDSVDVFVVLCSDVVYVLSTLTSHLVSVCLRYSNGQ